MAQHVSLVPLGGYREVHGLSSNPRAGWTRDERGRRTDDTVASPLRRSCIGPTTGDRIRLADTDLFIEITDDLSGGPGRAGDEAVFGGGKVLRESMGQGRRPVPRARPTP